MNRELIQRLDRVESESFVSLYGTSEAWGAGLHTRDGVTAVWSAHDDDPSFSCVLNLTSTTNPESTLQHLEDAARERGARVFGVSTHPDLDHWASEERLRGLGYEPDCEERIWALDLAAFDAPDTARPDVRIELAGPDDRTTFARTLNVGWSLPEDAARGHIFAAGIGLVNWRQYLAYVDDEVAGIAVLFMFDNVADCFLSATLPAFRGRGVQTALIKRRLADGLEAGCDLATSQTVVHNASPRNMARQGFQPLYQRWIYGKKLAGS